MNTSSSSSSPDQPDGAGSKVADQERIRALYATGLMDSEREEAYDRISRLVARTLRVPVSLVSLVDGERQFFKSAFGPVDCRETPLSHSFCRNCVESGQPFVIDDARQHPAVKNNPAIEDLGVTAYLGVPILNQTGHHLGALCAIQSEARQWKKEDIDTLNDLARLVEGQIILQAQLRAERTSRNLQELILKSAGEAIYGTDTSGDCTFCNPACVELLGFDSSDELIGQNIHSLIHQTLPDGSPYHNEKCRILRAISQGKGIRVDDEVFWRKDGTSFPAEYWSEPIKDGDKILGAVVAFVDISERIEARRELEEAQRKANLANELKTRFLAEVSHEIRTPMNAILGFSELLANHVDNPDAQNYLERIRRSGDGMMRVLTDLSDLSRIESDKLDLQPETTDIAMVVSSTIEMSSALAEKKGLELSSRIASDVPSHVHCGRYRVRQILLNLVNNAIKCTDEGSVVLECSRKPVSEETDPPKTVTLVFEVRDTGCGIAPGKLESIFAPFSQGSENGTEGSGLGLSISSKLAELMHGTLEVESTAGKGSCFTLTIPGLEVVNPGEEQEDAEKKPGFDLNDLKKSRIFVVDDNEDNRELAKRYLERSHHTVEVFSGAPEAIEAMRANPPDVVFMDIRMPGMDGEEAREIMLKDEGLSSIPVIAATVATFAHQEKSLRKSFDGYLAKPYTREHLFDGLKQVLPLNR